MGDITKEFREHVTDGTEHIEHGIDLVITIPMKPRGKQRPRATARGKHARVYTPKQTRTFEAEFADHARRQMPAEKLDGLLRIDIVAFIHRPKRLERKKDPDGPIFCGVAPDADNILKSAIDALQGFMVGTDAMVAHAQCTKLYTERGGKPRMLVRIRSLIAGTNERQSIQRAMFGHV